LHRIQQQLTGTDTMKVQTHKEPTLILRINDVMLRTGLPKSSVYEKVKKKELPPPIAISTRRAGWPSYEIDEINKALISGADPTTIKTLVSRLTSEREQSVEGDDNE